MTVHAIYQAHTGAPAALAVVEWDATVGGAGKQIGATFYAADIAKAREAIPPGKVRREPTRKNGEPKNLIETWEHVG